MGTRRELSKFFGSNAKGSGSRTVATTVPPAAALAAASAPGTAQRPGARRARRSPSHVRECPRRLHQPPPARVAKPPSADHVSPRIPDVQNRPRSGFPTRRAAVGRHVGYAHGGEPHVRSGLRRCDPHGRSKAGDLPPPDASGNRSVRGLSEATWQLECAECEGRTLLTGAVAGLSRKFVSRCYV